MQTLWYLALRAATILAITSVAGLAFGLFCAVVMPEDSLSGILRISMVVWLTLGVMLWGIEAYHRLRYGE